MHDIVTHEHGGAPISKEILVALCFLFLLPTRSMLAEQAKNRTKKAKLGQIDCLLAVYKTRLVGCIARKQSNKKYTTARGKTENRDPLSWMT